MDDLSSIRYKQRGDKFYVYEVTQYWDKELKKPRQTTKYLGSAKTKDGEYKKAVKNMPMKTEKAILDFGDTYSINEVTKTSGLLKIISDSFGDLSDSIMTLICYQITEGSSMSSCSEWSDSNIAHKLFPKSKIQSQDISRIFGALGQQEVQQTFFKHYIANFFPGKIGLLVDSTALPSAINSNINAFGYTSDGIKENVTCLMLVDRDSKLPIYFRAVGGDISDNSTLQTTIKEIKQLGLQAGSAILDAGYCSKENLIYMCNENIDFVTRLPKSHNIFYELIDDVDLIESHANAIKYGERIVFIKSIEKNIYGHKMTAHVILDPNTKAKDMNFVLKNSTEEELTTKQLDVINKKIKYGGFFILLSKSPISRQDVLPTYYTRQKIEQIFGFAKSNNSLLPLRVHSEQSVNGYLLLSFIALIVFIIMRQQLYPNISMNKALLRLRGLKAKVYEKELIIQEANKKVKDIANVLNIILPTSLGI